MFELHLQASTAPWSIFFNSNFYKPVVLHLGMRRTIHIRHPSTYYLFRVVGVTSACCVPALFMLWSGWRWQDVCFIKPASSVASVVQNWGRCDLLLTSSVTFIWIRVVNGVMLLNASMKRSPKRESSEGRALVLALTLWKMGNKFLVCPKPPMCLLTWGFRVNIQ